MKFSTSKTELQQALQKLSKATPTRSTLPILGCVLIDAGDEKTILKTTDLEISIQVEIPTSLEKTGRAAIPLKTLLEVTNELPEVRVTIEVDDKNKATITTDLGEYDLMAKQPEEFPKTPEQKSPAVIKIPGKTLKQIINSTSFAISRDELKPALTGVLLQISSESTTAVSTDGHRLVKQTRGDFRSADSINDFIVPKKFLGYLSSHLGDIDVELLLAEDHLAARVGADLVITRIIDETFPNYESVIPKENNKKLVVDKKVLLGAIKRVSIFSNKSTHQVALSLSSEECKITTEDPEKSSKANEKISAQYEGDPIVIGYNAEYLKDVVSHVPGDEVVVELSSSVSAALFSSLQSEEQVESIMLLMPIRLND
ncbi:MAG: DNA polymerase III subunit beta [Candidatus Neomarinimicrobiota bacterium]